MFLFSVGSGCGDDFRSIADADTGARGEKPLSTSAEDATKRINWIGHWLHEDLREKLVREMGEEYRFEHPDTELRLSFPQEIMGSRSKPLMGEYIAEMIRTGNIGWDVIWLDDNIYACTAVILNDPDWGRKHLVDFKTVPEFVGTQKPFIVSNPVYRNQTGGVIAGPYIEGYLYALWYNRSLADRMGLSIKERGMTFEDLLGCVEAVASYNETSSSPVAAFYEAKDWLTTEILFQNLVKSEFDNLMEANSHDCSERKRSALLKGLLAFEQLAKHAPLLASHNENIWFDTRHLVLEDKALFFVNGTWMYSHWRGIDEEKMNKMVPAELPVFREVSHGLGGYIPTWAVPKNAPNREAAVEFLLWWSRPKVAEKWVRYTKNPTGLRGNFEHPTLAGDVYEKFQADMTAKYRSNLSYCADGGYILGKAHTVARAEFETRLREILEGKTTAREAYEAILEICEGKQP